MSRIKFTDRKKPWAIKKSGGSVAAVYERRRRILVITQDEKSSRYYLEAIADRMAPGAMEVRVAFQNDSPQKLVEAVPGCQAKAVGQLRQAHPGASAISFEKTWVVFDKDDFDDFDEAVRDAQTRGYGLAMSNECFELWYLLHFRDVLPTERLPRQTIFAELRRHFGLASEYEKVKGAQGKDLIHVPMARSFSLKSPEFLRAQLLAARNVVWNGGRREVRHSVTLIHELLAFLATQMPAAHVEATTGSEVEDG